MWRKRIGWHIRDCATCTGTAAGRVPAESLLADLAPLAVPAALVGELIAKGLLSGGATFTARSTGLPADGRLKALPGRAGDLWIAGGGKGLFHSTDVAARSPGSPR